MDSFEEIQRQLRFALIALGIILPVGISGYVLIEGVSVLDAMWITITTLTTIGYGDLVAKSDTGRVFTLFLIVFGLGSFALAAQAAVQIFISPAIKDIRIRRKAERKIQALRDHYVICGEGEIVDKLIGYIIKRAELRRNNQREAVSTPITRNLQRVFGRKEKGIRAKIRNFLQTSIVNTKMIVHRGETFLDVVVVVTQNPTYASHLREDGLLVIEEDPTDDRALRHAGIIHARSVMSLLEHDTETLLNVLTVRSRNPRVYITAATHENLATKMTQVGANNVIAPYDVAGQFLNNATLRPAVNDYFNSILFDQRASAQIVQLFIWENSPWLGKRLSDLNLRNRFNTGIIGIRLDDGSFIYAPNDDHMIREEEVVLAVTPGSLIPSLQRACQGTDVYRGGKLPNWQRLPMPQVIKTSEKIYSIVEAEDSIKGLNQHYIICGSGPLLQSALDKLDPSRPFVVVTDNGTQASEMLQRGFRVIMGSPAQETTLIKAGVRNALAIMISIEDKADNVLTTLNCRTLNRKLMIVATAHTDDMIPKLRRAGADRVVSPFRIAAQFLLLATARPVISDFMQYVLFNYQTGIETTELYMQDDSPWIGKGIGDLYLERIFHAGIIGIRQAKGGFVYAPPTTYEIQPKDVLIVITPMRHADELRVTAHGSRIRPDTLRTKEILRTTSGLDRA